MSDWGRPCWWRRRPTPCTWPRRREPPASTSAGRPAGRALRGRAVERGHKGAHREGLGISATDNYGLSEVVGPGVSGECELQATACTSPRTTFIAEVVDPATGGAAPGR